MRRDTSAWEYRRANRFAKSHSLTVTTTTTTLRVAHPPDTSPARGARARAPGSLPARRAMSSEGTTARAGARDAVTSSSPNASSPAAAANQRRHHVAWALVARRLDAAWDVCALSCVARSLAAIARDDDVWRALCATRGVERGVDDEGGGVLDASPEDRRHLPSWRDAFARRTREERRAWASARRSALRVAEAEHRERVRAARRAASELRAESRRATEARAKARAAAEAAADDEDGGGSSSGADANDRRVERRRRARPVSWHRARCASFARTNAARVAEDAATRAAIRRSRAEAEARASEEALERERRRARFYDGGGSPSAKVR